MLLKKTFAAAAGLVGVAHSTPVELAERQLVCPDNGTQLVIQNRVISYPVVINQFFGENTIININGGVTININNAPVTLSTTVTATTTVAATVTVGAATVATPFIIQIGGAPVARKRQLNGLFLGAGGQAVTECGDATVFSLTNGQLFSGGQIVSTNNGLAQSPLAPSAAIGDITGTFSAAGSLLEWTNPLFNAGSATFCLISSILNAAFSAEAQAGCVGQGLTILDASTCTDLSSSSSSSSTASSTSSSGSTSATDAVTTSGTSSGTSTSGSATTSAPTSSDALSSAVSSLTSEINQITSSLLPTTTGGGGGVISVIESGATGIIGVATSCLNAGDVNCIVSGVVGGATSIVGGVTSIAVPVVTSLAGGVVSVVESGAGGIVSAATSCLSSGDVGCVVTAVVGGATSIVGGAVTQIGGAVSSLGVPLPTISLPVIGGGL